jgi:hypothetical protein
MGIALDVIFFVCWVAVFVMIIRRGFIDRTFGVPFVAIFVNLAWDLECAFIFKLPVPQVYTEVLFAIFDVIIMAQLFSYWRSEFPTLSPGVLYSMAALTLITGLVICVAVTMQFNDTWNFYSGYAGNFLGCSTSCCFSARMCAASQSILRCSRGLVLAQHQWGLHSFRRRVTNIRSSCPSSV